MILIYVGLMLVKEHGNVHLHFINFVSSNDAAKCEDCAALYIYI
jgi:hypothetical protein